MDFTFLGEAFLTLLTGLPLTLGLAAASVACGFALASLFCWMRLSGVAALDWIARGYVLVFRGTPLLVQIFLIYYGLGQFRPTLQWLGLWSFFREPYWCALTALALNTGAYSCEILRGGFLSVPAGEVMAGRACGMGRFLLFRRIRLPIALRQALPGYGNEVISMVKATSLASIITMLEVTGLAQRLIAQTYRAVEVFVCAGAIYLAINFLVTRVILALEIWLAPHLRPAPVSTVALPGIVPEPGTP